jgi:hypothetical protein
MGLPAHVLRDLITDPEAPTAYELRGGGACVARVSDLVAFVSSRVSSDTDVEAALDAYIADIGGCRTHVVDVDLKRAWRRLRGRPVSSAEEVYEIPGAVFEAAGRRQTNVSLPPGRTGT